MTRRFLAGAIAAISLAAIGCPTVANAEIRTNQAVQSLPSTRLEFGLGNTDVSWMTASGVPWKYRYAYLAGGVNTANNWLTWQDPSLPPGQYALDYMNSSTGSPANYVPVFTWYELLQSTPSTGSTESDRDYSNLNNASTMNSYYSSFKVLMQKAAQYGRQVVVHVEPDFWGYMQQKAAGGSATSISATVKSSGFAEAAAFPDNLVGFASELKYLRDTYAPNALLAMHASMWSSGIDLASDTDPTLNPVNEADKTAAFLGSAGAAGWDALFNDVDDHDAAWWELASCGTPPCVNKYFTHWWDSTNTTYPNFSRYLSWVAELHSKTGLPQVSWQVPNGNQYFLTMNNTCGHYQDNVAAYFIAHASALFNAGLVAVLFGAGNGCQTNYYDASHDGITNNGGVATTDALGGCSACNTQASSWADDDGGYLRIFVGRYYAGQSTCLSVALTAAPPTRQTTGGSVTLTASASGCSNPQYEFWTLAPGASNWTPVQPYSSAASWTWPTSGLAPGAYGLAVWARDASSSGLYSNGFGGWDAASSLGYSLVRPACTALSFSAVPSSTASVGSPVDLTAGASCPDANPVYQFWGLAPRASSWTVLQPYSTTNSFTWSTTGQAPGSYQLAVWVRDAGSNGVYSNGFGSWDMAASRSYTVTTCAGLSLNGSPGSPIAIGGTVNFTAGATGCPDPNPDYQFWVLAPGATNWTAAQTYSSNGTFSWGTAGKAPGNWQIAVWARDASSAGAYSNGLGSWDLATSRSYTVATCTGATLSASPASSTSVGTSVTLTAGATGCPNPSPEFQFWVLAPGASTWTVVQSYSTSNQFTWATAGNAKGNYEVAVWARDAQSAGAHSNSLGNWDAASAISYSLN